MDERSAHDQINIFLSYARDDGTEHAKRFFNELTRSPQYTVTYDRHFRLSEDFDVSMETAIASADVMLVILTDASARRDWVRREIGCADRRNRNKQRIRLVVCQMTESPDIPIWIQNKPRLNFVTDPEAWTKLYEELNAEALPVNGARLFSDVDDAPSDQRHTTAAREAADRAQAERLRAVNLAGAADRLRERVKADQEREQSTRSTTRSEADLLMINEMPELPEIKFQDRLPKLTAIDGWLGGPAARVVLVTGGGGTGKTAFLREYRRRLAARTMSAPADAFVYLAVRGYRQLSAAVVLDDLSLAAPRPGDVQRTIQRGRLSWRERLHTVLDALGSTPVIVAIDDAEDLLDRRGEIFDRDLRAVLAGLIGRPRHQVRVLLTVRERRTYPLRETFPGQVEVCDLEKGLPASHTKPFLEALDSDDLLSVEGWPKRALERLGVISNGNPRFLELVYSLLRSDPDLDVTDLLDDLDAASDDRAHDPFPTLIDAVLGRLDRTDRRVVQALAVYGAPVRPAAVDHLLGPYVPGVDSAPVLRQLAGRALLRRDGDRYFLPPEPDARCVLASLPSGGQEDWQVAAPFTLRFLRRRAADFYDEISPRDVHRPEDLDVRLKAIGLRIAAGDYEVAVEAMQSIDKEFLTGWGQSGVLTRWREEVDAKIAKGTRARAANLSYLISAAAGEEDHHGRWAARLAEVLTEPWLTGEPEDRIRFGIQLADVCADSGYLDDAAERYDEAARRCRSKALRHEAVLARVARGGCLARLGAFDRARTEFDQARKWLPSLAGGQYAEAASLLALNEGWMLGQLDDPLAMPLLEDGLKAATDAKDTLLRARLLDGLADLLCDNRRIGEAVDRAVEAARIAMQSGNQKLSRNANVTLALAYLLSGDPDDIGNAEAAVHTACQQPPGHAALAARALEGVVEFRKGDMPAARAAFHAACTEAWLRLQRAPGEFTVYDATGLALTGLELCGEPYRLPRAFDMYRQARRIAPVSAKGACRRSQTQLSLLDGPAHREVVEMARRAAGGDEVDSYLSA